MREKCLDMVDVTITHGMYQHLCSYAINTDHLHQEDDYLSITKHFVSNGHVHTFNVHSRIITEGSFDRLAHGEEEAKKAEATAKAIFTGGDAANMPSAKLEAESFTDDEIDAINLVFGAGLATTKSEARRTIQQGGVSVDGEKVADIAAKFPKSMFEGDGVVVKKGKKSFVKVSVN
jgi:tyrosyl-tRNA synthetase